MSGDIAVPLEPKPPHHKAEQIKLAAEKSAELLKKHNAIARNRSNQLRQQVAFGTCLKSVQSREEMQAKYGGPITPEEWNGLRIISRPMRRRILLAFKRAHQDAQGAA